MVDKARWTEPLDSEREALGFVSEAEKGTGGLGSAGGISPARMGLAPESGIVDGQ